MELLGGLVHTDENDLVGYRAEGLAIEKQFSFSAVNGALEIALHDLLQHCQNNAISHPEWVSLFLVEALEELCGFSLRGKKQEALALVRRLCIADRHYLLTRWRIQHCNAVQWFTCLCKSCKERFDFPLDWRNIPIKPAGDSFPFVRLALSSGWCALRVPDGSDQEWIASKNFSDLPYKSLLSCRLLLEKRSDTFKFSEQDIQKIEEAVEDASPEFAESVSILCPECQAENSIKIDFYQGIVKSVESLLDDVHRLAVHYHWSEKEILSLPAQRRAQYLSRLDKSRGMQGGQFV